MTEETVVTCAEAKSGETGNGTSPSTTDERQQVLRFKLAGHPTETTDRSWCPGPEIKDWQKVPFKDIKKQVFDDELQNDYKVNLFFSGRKVEENRGMEENKIPKESFLHAWFSKISEAAAPPSSGQPEPAKQSQQQGGGQISAAAGVAAAGNTANASATAQTPAATTSSTAASQNQHQAPSGLRRILNCCCIS